MLLATGAGPPSTSRSGSRGAGRVGAGRVGAGYVGAESEVPGMATAAHPYVLNRIEITLDDGLNGFVSKLKAAQAGTPDSSVSPGG